MKWQVVSPSSGPPEPRLMPFKGPGQHRIEDLQSGRMVSGLTWQKTNGLEEGSYRSGCEERHDHVESKAHDYRRPGFVKTTMGRQKFIIGDRLYARHDDAQPVELAIGINALKQMTDAAKPVSVRVG